MQNAAVDECEWREDAETTVNLDISNRDRGQFDNQGNWWIGRPPPTRPIDRASGVFAAAGIDLPQHRNVLRAASSAGLTVVYFGNVVAKQRAVCLRRSDIVASPDIVCPLRRAGGMTQGART